MKKFIVTALAAGALAAGSAASAQDLGSTILNLLGFGQPQYGSQYGYNGYGVPGVVVPDQQPATQIYRDAYGRQFYYDQYGRQVYLQQNNTQQIVGYDAWGRPVYGNAGAYAYGYGYASTWDRDGDGIANSRDRWPDDPRYQ